MEDLPGAAQEQGPSVIFGRGDNCFDLTVSVRNHRFVAQSHVQNELGKRIFRRLRQEGIEYPNGRGHTGTQQGAEFRQENWVKPLYYIGMFPIDLKRRRGLS